MILTSRHFNGYLYAYSEMNVTDHDNFLIKLLMHLIKLHFTTIASH